MRANRGLLAVLLLALALRLAFGLSQDHLSVYEKRGGDSWVYLDMGYNLMTGFDYSEVALPTAPVYLIFNGSLQILLPPAAAVITIRIIQAVLGALTCWLLYRLALLTSGSPRAGLIAAGVVAVAPVFVIEAAQITTETLYIFLLTAGLTLHVSLSASARPAWLGWAGVGLVFGLATLTRAVALLFPLGLALHLLLHYGRRRGVKPAALLLSVYVLVVSTWTVHNLVHWNRFVIAADGFAAFLYVGATNWQGPEQVDQNLIQDANLNGAIPDDRAEREAVYQAAAANIILNNPLGYAQRRITQLIEAYAQPHGTLYYSGPSLKDLAADWLRADRSPAGLIALTRAEGFWPKLALYGLHYTALGLGVVGLWLTRRRWRLMLPLAGFILYTTLVHLVLDAIPRYIFPTEGFWWVFAGIALAALADRRRGASLEQPNVSQRMVQL